MKKANMIHVNEKTWDLPVLFADCLGVSGNAFHVRLNFGAWRQAPKNSFIRQASIGMPTQAARELHRLLGDLFERIEAMEEPDAQ